MAKPREVDISISQLSLNESPPDESVPSGSWPANMTQSCHCQSTLYYNTRLGEIYREVEPTQRMPSIIHNTDLYDLSKAETVGASNRSEDSQMKFDGSETESESTDNRGSTAIERPTSSKEDDITISHNYGTVIVDLGEEYIDEPMTGFDKKSYHADFTPSGAFSRSKAVIPSRAVRTRSFRSVVSNTPRNQLQRKRLNRIQRQNLVLFRQRKNKNNVKSVSGKISHIRENVNALDNRIVNINIVNNSGKIIIGDDVTYHESSQEQGSCHLSNDDGDSVVADGSIIVSPQRSPVVYIDKNTMKWLNKFYKITNEIYPLRDNGRWEDFYHKVDRGLQLAKQNGHQEEEIFMTIEKSIALSYQMKNDQSMQMVKLAKDMILSRPGINMREFLVALSHCQLAALYRRTNKMSKANKSVYIAEQNVEFVPSHLAKAYVSYEKASNQKADEGCAENARKELKHCISVCERMLLENSSIYLRKHHFSLVKLAMMNLNCGTTAARSQPVSEDNIREANDCIRRMQQRYSGQISEAASNQLRIAQACIFYRRGDYAGAETVAHQALLKAESLVLPAEVKSLQEGLKHIIELKQQERCKCDSDTTN